MSRVSLGVVPILIEVANCRLEFDHSAIEEGMVLGIDCLLESPQEVPQDKSHRSCVETTSTRLMLFTINLPVMSHFAGNLTNLTIVALNQLFLPHKLLQVSLQTVEAQGTLNHILFF